MDKNKIIHNLRNLEATDESIKGKTIVFIIKINDLF